MAFYSSESISAPLYPAGSIQNAIEHFVWCIHLSFANFALHPNPTNKNLPELGLQIQAALSISVTVQNYTNVHMDFFPHKDQYYHLSNY